MPIFYSDGLFRLSSVFVIVTDYSNPFEVQASGEGGLICFAVSLDQDALVDSM